VNLLNPLVIDTFGVIQRFSVDFTDSKGNFPLSRGLVLDLVLLVELQQSKTQCARVDQPARVVD
jgi:hypothetical protein